MNPSNNHFGLTVAYLLPGFIALAGIAPIVQSVKDWLRPVDQGAAGFGPAVYAVLSAIATGMVISCIRWITIDWIHRRAGILPPDWNDAMLDENLAAFNYLVENHYRYAQFYGNSLIAIIFAYGVNRFMRTSGSLGLGTDLGVLLLCAILFAGSRDALAKYYNRSRRLVGVIAEKGVAGDTMTNGNHHSHDSGAGSSTQKRTKSKKQLKLLPKPPPPEVTAPKQQK